MDNVKRIVRNSILLNISQIISSFFMFIYFLAAARYLGAANLGIITFAMALTGIFGVIADMGFQALITREVARDKSLSSKYIANVSGIKLVLNALFLLVILAITYFMAYSQQTVVVIFMFSLSMAINSFTSMYYSLFRAHEKMGQQAIGQIINGGLMFIGSLIAIRLRFNVIGFTAIYSLANLCSFSYCLAVFMNNYYRHSLAEVKLKIETDWLFWKQVIVAAIPFGLANIFVATFNWIDSTMLFAMKGSEAVGLYNASYRIIFFLLFIPNSIIAAVFPFTSRSYMADRSGRQMQLSIHKTLKILAMIGLPIGVGATLLAKNIIVLLYGEGYMLSVLPLQILVWATVAIFLDQTYANILNSMNKTLILTKITALCVLVNIVLNIILIPKYGMIGASVVTVITQFICSGLIFVACSKMGYKIINKDNVAILTKILAANFCMGGLIIYCRDINLYLLIILSIITYVLTLLMLGAIKRDEIEIMFNLKIIKKGISA